MRALACVLLFLPLPLWAADIPVTSRVSAVTLYPQGGTVMREAEFAAAPGQHRLIVADLPASVPLSAVRVAVEGATMGGVSLRDDYVPPRDAAEDAALEAARAEVERLEAALREGAAGVEAIEMEEAAAKARVAFLDRLGAGEAVAGMDAGGLRALSDMIGQEGLAARQAALDARLRAKEADRALDDLREELEDARAALRALVPEDAARAMVAVDITAEAASEGRLRITYPIPQAGWTPVYDFRLARKAGRLEIARGAFLRQSTGENWRDVVLTLSTRRPSGQTAPSEISPWVPRIFEPEELRPKSLSRAEGAAFDQAAPQMEPALAAEATPRFDGLSVSYAAPGPVSVASGADRVRVALGTQEVAAQPGARAVPLSDDRAFLMAGFTNDAEQVILPTGEARFYLDGRFVGQRAVGMIPAGGETELSFGPVDGLRLSRIVPEREEGDRGVFTASSAIDETVRIEVENLTGEAWPVRLLDRVPVSEQEDLEIDWQARPGPSETDVDGKRGVLEWRFDIAPGETRAVTLDYTLQWPEGQVLR